MNFKIYKNAILLIRTSQRTDPMSPDLYTSGSNLTDRAQIAILNHINHVRILT